MCLPSILWTFILFYVPLFRSMGLHPVLCAIIPPYVPSFDSMGLYPVLCAVIRVYVPSFDSMGLYPVLCAVIPLYVPSSRSMCPRSALCAFIPFYVPSFPPMCRHPNLWTVLHVLCANHHYHHNKKTERRLLYQSSFGPHHPGLAPPLNPQLSFNSLNMSLAASSPCFMQSGMPTPSHELPARLTPGKSSANCLSTACNLST